jgi:hypothetical protein
MLEKTFDPATLEAARYEQWEGSGAFAAHPEKTPRRSAS